MTNLLERAPEMSVADRNFDTDEEVTTMTAATYQPSARRVRPHGIDRAIMRLSLMTLLWARRHAERTAVSHEEHTRMHRELQAVQRREHDAALLLARVR